MIRPLTPEPMIESNPPSTVAGKAFRPISNTVGASP